jgi:hypothetical protein
MKPDGGTMTVPGEQHHASPQSPAGKTDKIQLSRTPQP